MLDYKLLEALAAVLDNGGFERGAKTLCISQSAVSQRIRLLEDQLGLVLLSRTTPPTPTTAGERLLAHYRKVHHLEEHLFEEDFPFLSEKPRKRLSLGINADSLATWFMELVAPYVASHSLLLDLHVDDQDHTMELLRKGIVLGCISSQRLPIQGCRVDYLGANEYLLVCTPVFFSTYLESDEVSANSLADLPTVFFNRKDKLTFQYFSHAFRQDVEFKQVNYIPSSEKYLQLILGSSCYGLVPEIQARSYLDTEQLIEIFPARRLRVPLYFHRWNLTTGWLEHFSHQFISTCNQKLASLEIHPPPL